MKSIEFLKGWKENYVTIFLEHNIFKNENDEIDKITKVFALFSPFNARFQFNTEEKDKFLEELLLIKKYDIKVIHTGKRLFSKKQYKQIEVYTNEFSSNNLIKLAIQHKVTLEFELEFNDQNKVIGVLYGDAGESHSIHFNTAFSNIEEINNQINNIFK